MKHPTRSYSHLTPLVTPPLMPQHGHLLVRRKEDSKANPSGGFYVDVYKVAT